MKTKNHISHWLALLAVLLAPVLAQAQYEYTVLPGGTTIMITRYSGSEGDVIIPSSYEGFTVISIGELAFNSNSIVTSVTIPSSVITVEGGAFVSCHALTSVNIPNSVQAIGTAAFLNCSSLASVSIPNSVTFLGDAAFQLCSSLTSVTMGSGLKNVPFLAFAQCTNLTSLVIGSTVTNIGESAFVECIKLKQVTIPSSVKTLSKGAFGRTGLTNLVIPAHVLSVGALAFTHCSNLTNLTIANGVTTIDDLAFQFTGIKAVNLPASVTHLGANPFTLCTNLIDLTVDNSNPAFESVLNVDAHLNRYYVLFNKTRTKIVALSPGYRYSQIPAPSFPASVTNIGGFAFSGMDHVVIPQNVSVIEFDAFDGGKQTEIPHLPNLVSIGDRAFRYSRLTSLNLQGSPMLKSIGDGAFESCLMPGTTVVIPGGVTNWGVGSFGYTHITGVIIGEGITKVPDYTFQYCYNLISVILPNSLTNIGEAAFVRCENLPTISIPDGVSSIGVGAFSRCLKLSIAQLPASLTFIADGAFALCGKLSSMTIPNTVRFIGTNAFTKCDLRNVTIPNNVTNLGEFAFEGCGQLTNATIGTSIRNLQKAVFANTGLLGVTIPAAVTNIGELAFYGCSALRSATLGNAITRIEDYAFANCLELRNIVLPASVTSLGKGAFRNGASLTAITIPENVVFMGDEAFLNCPGLTNITFMGAAPAVGGIDVLQYDPNTIVYYPLGASGWNPPITTWQQRPAVPWDPVSRCLLSLAGGVVSVTKYIGSNGVVNIPASLGGFPIRSIGASAFAGSGVTVVTIPDGVLNIGAGAFQGCLGLTTLILPDSLTSIAGNGLASCANLASVTFGTNFSQIGSGAFAGCSSLQSLYFKGTGVPSNPSPNHFFSSTKVYYPFGGNAGTWSSTFADATVAPWDPNGNFLVQSSGGTITITGYAGSGGAASIPAQIGGLPVVAIAPNAFQNTALTSITIPDSVKNIGDNAFFHCTSLSSVTMGNGVTNIGVMAFYQCTALNLINFGSGVTTIGDYAMAECNMLSIFIPASVTKIGSSCFSGTPAHSIYFKGNAPALSGIGLLFGTSATIYYVPGTTGWGPIGSAFAGRATALWSDVVPSRLELANGALSVTLYVAINGGPNAAVTIPPVIGGYPVTSIGVHAFQAVFMASVTLPDSVRDIGSEAFIGCPYLTSVNMGNGVTNIGPSAFQGCTSLNNLIFPSSLSTLSASAFIGDVNLKSIFFWGNAPSLDSQVFPGTSVTMYYLPGKTGWGTFLGDQPAVLWNPLLQASGPGLGVQGNQFIIRITGGPNLPIAIESCDDLANPVWHRLQTGTLTNGLIQFNDPVNPATPQRFYHVSSP